VTVTAGATAPAPFDLTCAAPLIGTIAFESNRDGDQEIFRMGADGTGPVNLTNNGVFDFDAEWSPDASKILFVSERDGNDELYLMNPDGSGQTRLTDEPSAEDGPAWSPDGARIAFETDRDGNAEIYVMDADGSGATNLTNNAAQELHPASTYSAGCCRSCSAIAAPKFDDIP